MAETSTKRQSIAGKVATPKLSGTPQPGSKDISEQDAALYKSIGARVKITTVTNSTFEGTIFTADPLTNIVALNTTPAPPTPASASTTLQPSDFYLLPVGQIQSFEMVKAAEQMDREEGSGPGFEGALPAIYKLDKAALDVKVKNAVKKQREYDESRGKGVSKEAQEVFDHFKKTLPTRWDGKNIIVSEQVLVKEPYGVEDCQAPKDRKAALEHAKKVLTHYYQRKGGAGNNRAAVATPIAPRKGG